MSLISTCKATGALPRPGGLLAQDSLFVYLLQVYETASNERRELDERRKANAQQRKG